MTVQIFVCKDDNQKKHRLTLDGGSSGNYQLELCQSCYDAEDKRFVISEEGL